ncbi:MAG: outer membrane beta-barrel protein [Nitrospinales bacterium]
MPRILELRIVLLVSLILFVLLGFFLINPGVFAEEKFERSGFWGGVDFGVGFVQRSFAGIEEDENNFFLGFEGGYTLNPHFLIGVGLSGWLLEASDLEDPSKGEGISQVFLITRYYPSSSMGLFAKIGGGYVSYWNNRPGEPSSKDGWGLTFGGGYDFPLNENFAISPFINYGFGEADDQDHNVWTLGIGLTFQ